MLLVVMLGAAACSSDDGEKVGLLPAFEEVTTTAQPTATETAALTPAPTPTTTSTSVVSPTPTSAPTSTPAPSPPPSPTPWFTPTPTPEPVTPPWAEIPDGPWSEVSVGLDFACGLHEDGTVDCWGVLRRDCAFPNLAELRWDETIDCWGDRSYGQLAAPEDKFTAISAGQTHSCGLRINGTIKGSVSFFV